MAQLVERLLRNGVLAASSAREAGLSHLEELHLQYGIDVVQAFQGSCSKFNMSKETQAEVFVQMGIRYKRMEDDPTNNKAVHYFQQALQIHPNNGHALVHLASLPQQSDYQAIIDSIQHLDATYVAGLFDGYAARFERELVDELQYQGHVLVADALAAFINWSTSLVVPQGNAIITVVDLGCGTGLLGELIRRQVHKAVPLSCSDGDVGTGTTATQVHIVGVDLSQGMTEISRHRTIQLDNDAQQQASMATMPVYNQVETVDGLEYFQGLQAASVRAVVASDVFIYIGALERTFHECARVLVNDGLLAFTLELIVDPKDRAAGVKLLKSGRFGHSKGHVEKVAKAFGFVMDLWKEDVLRTQGGNPVTGAVVVLRRVYSN